MHIVLVCREYVGSLRAGGIGSYMQEIARKYVDNGHKVTVITASDNTAEESEYITSDGINVVSLSGGDFLVPSVEGKSKIKKLRCIYRFHSYRKKLRDAIKRLADADIIEVADYGAEALYMSHLNVPVVIRLHTPQSLSRANFGIITPKWWWLHRALPINAERKIFNQAKYITGCSNAILDWVARHYDISKAKTAVIKNPVTVPSVAPVSLSPEASNDKKTIFYAGTISETKGVGDMIEACLRLRKQGFDIKLKLAGKGGSFHDMMQKKAEDNGWSWIEFLGKLSREEVFKNYLSADICCFPSWWENMPMVVLESMALGAVVVSTNAGGTGEIITDGHDGFLCERRNPEQLSETICKALTLSKDYRSEIKENAKKTVREKFSADIIASEMLEYFKSVIVDFNKNKI